MDPPIRRTDGPRPSEGTGRRRVVEPGQKGMAGWRCVGEQRHVVPKTDWIRLVISDFPRNLFAKKSHHES